MTPTTYRSQSGKVTPIAKMVDEHLANAIAKLRRDRKSGPLLDAEAKRRQASGAAGGTS